MMRALAVVLSAVLSVAGVWAKDAPVVATREGRISGILEKSTKGKVFYSFYGVPYATPPLGDLRLKDPVAAEPWEGVLDASTMPEMCLQVPFTDTLEGLRPPPEEWSGSEDCLYLNVFTPTLEYSEGRSLPVMVWIHGGGFFSGGANEYLPHVLLNHDIVLVVIQYRLGLLGFLSTEDSVIPGNFGLKDQTLALEWVQRNIHKFGGARKRVTISGQSAGGASVHFHLMSPKSDGLFVRAIMHSGAAISPWGMTRTHGDQTQHVASALGCPTHEGSEALLACLQAADGRELAAVALDFFRWFILPMVVGPRVDGDFVPEEPGLLVRKGYNKSVDFMIGHTADDGAVFVQSMMAEKELVSALESNFSAIAPVTLQCQADTADPASVARRVYRHYLGQEGNLDPVAQKEQLMRMFTDRHVKVDVEFVAQHHVRNPRSRGAYRYVFNHRGQLSFSDMAIEAGRHWVVHGDDLYYLFRGGPFLQPLRQPAERPQDLQRQEDLSLRDIMTTLWVNFATVGTPTPEDSLGFMWEPATEDNLQYLELKPRPTMQPDQNQEVRRFHASLPTKTNLALHPHLVREEPDAGAPEHTRGAQDEL